MKKILTMGLIFKIFLSSLIAYIRTPENFENLVLLSQNRKNHFCVFELWPKNQILYKISNI